jgi:hypothetical protein
MDLAALLAELKRERDDIVRAIEALERVAKGRAPKRGSDGGGKREGAGEEGEEAAGVT